MDGAPRFGAAARTWAEISASPLATAAAARELAIVLRHQDHNDAAQRLMSAAAADPWHTPLPGAGSAPRPWR